MLEIAAVVVGLAVLFAVVELWPSPFERRLLARERRRKREERR